MQTNQIRLNLSIDSDGINTADDNFKSISSQVK